jgi:glc operon protein GlcG
MRPFVFVLALLAPVAFARGADAPRAVTAFDGAQVRGAFEKGAPLLETAAYKIHASRREAPGVGEVHVKDTDILYVLEGSATLVTGGSLVDPKQVAPDELRGSAIAGGETREIAQGDVVVVPNGTPHWFRAVRPPVLYYVVKVTDGAFERTDAGGAR